jgi:hypothetical protein
MACVLGGDKKHNNQTRTCSPLGFSFTLLVHVKLKNAKTVPDAIASPRDGAKKKSRLLDSRWTKEAKLSVLHRHLLSVTNFQK